MNQTLNSNQPNPQIIITKLNNLKQQKAPTKQAQTNQRHQTQN